MRFLEKNLEDIIFEADNKLLNNRGLYLCNNKKRQVNIGNYGIADMLCWELNRSNASPCSEYYNNEIECKNCNNLKCKRADYINIQLLELKQQKINIGTFLQAIGYLKGILSYLEKRNFKIEKKISIILIGGEIDLDSNFIYLTDVLNYREEELAFNL